MARIDSHQQALKALVDDAQCWAGARLGQTDYQTEKCSTRADWRGYLGTPKLARKRRGA